MEQPTKKMGRPPKPSGERRRKHLTFRLSDELYDQLSEKAKIEGGSISQAIESRLALASWLANNSTVGLITFEDISDFSKYAAFVQDTIAEAGEDRDRWRHYSGIASFPDILGDAAARETARRKRHQAVERAYQEAAAALAKSGPPIPITEPRRRLSSGKDVSSRMDDYFNEVIVPRENARLVERITRNRLKLDADLTDREIGDADA